VLTVALDYDGVSYPFSHAISGWAGERGIDLPSDPVERSYWRGCGLDDAGWDALLVEFGEDGGYRREAPYPEALEGINAIFDAGHDLLGVTSRPATRAIEASTFGWTADWVLPLRSILIGPGSKMAAECDLVVDDDPDEIVQVEELGEASGLLLDAPWNQEAEGFVRVTWAQLPEVVEALASAVAAEAPSDRRFVLVEMLDEIRRPISA